MLIYNVTIVNEGILFPGALLIEGERIARVLREEEAVVFLQAFTGEVLDGGGRYLLPGVIDDQVHFREPGLTHKGDIYTESRAAAAGGITSYMEMPNTVPQTLTQELLEQKYNLASERSAVNYSFYMGASNQNLAELRRTDPKSVCGIKVFMGASTGNMLVDDPVSLEAIFAESPCIVAVHSEDEGVIRENVRRYFLGDDATAIRDDVTARYHPLIRSREACIRSTEKALSLAEKHGTRLHILHLSTEEEVAMMSDGSLSEKRITSEVCVHHLWFSSEDYSRKGNLIKWNPSIKDGRDRAALLEGLLSGRIDIVATDHAPHTLEEKRKPYQLAPSGGPLVQHALPVMLEIVHQGRMSIADMVRYMSHRPADLFSIARRGYIREGYFADLVLVDLHDPWTVTKDNILYKCGWSPFEGISLTSRITSTWVNGSLVYDGDNVVEGVRGKRLMFTR